MDFQSASFIVAWALIIILGIIGLIMVGWSGDDDASFGARLTRLFIGFILMVLAWKIWQNISSANLIVGWVLLIILGILGIFLIWGGIADRSFGTKSVIGGIVSMGLAFLIANQWLGINNIFGWIIFIILGIFGLVMIGWGIYDINDFEQSTGIMKIIGGLISTTLALVISYNWLHLTSILNITGWVFFWIFGVLGVLATIIGLIIIITGRMSEDKKIGIYFFIGGTSGIGLAFVVGSFALHLPWLSNISVWNPFFILPITTMITGIIVGFIMNFFEDASYNAGNTIDKSAEWRIVGSNAKYSDATVRDTYDHVHGRGSWAKSTKSSINFWRIVCVVVSAFGFIGLLLYTSIKDTYPVLVIPINEFNTYSVLIKIALFAILLLISSLIEYIFATTSKHK